MWSEACSSVCRRHPSVVAAFESPRGRLALLLRHTLTPTLEATARWRNETSIGARTVTADLRAVGLTGDVIILQWCSLRLIADVVAHWDCTYEGDERRRAQLIETVTTRSPSSW
jgi:hypothetical protein